MADRMQTKTRNPAWWTDKHASAWDQVKEALGRDWEQTKSDLSKKGGQKLNQNAADTVKQSVGSVPIPPLGAKTRETDPAWGALAPFAAFGAGAAARCEQPARRRNETRTKALIAPPPA
jgi:hypothetical protein